MNKLRVSSILYSVSFGFSKNSLKSSKSPISFCISQNPRFYGRKIVDEAEYRIDSSEIDSVKEENRCKISPALIREVQDSLLEYLHWTRNLQFLDAERMSRNSPIFVEKLLQKVQNEDEENIGRSITRFLCYHPINEFEPFFESLGLKPFEYSVLLPKNLMFLSDDRQLLANYTVLCTYGFSTDSIGNICREAYEIFGYDDGVLLSKLRSFEVIGLSQSHVIKIIASSPSLLIGDTSELLFRVLEKVKNIGLSQSNVIKIIASSPSLLIGDTSDLLFRVLEKLKNIGFDYCWVDRHLTGISYKWANILELLHFFSRIGCNEDQQRRMINHNPGLLLNESGTKTFSMIGFLIKFGLTKDDLSSIFINIHQHDLNEYFSNLLQCYIFFVKMGMKPEEIGRLVRSHTNLLGSCRLNRDIPISDKKRTHRIIINSREALRKWVLIERSRERQKINAERSKFLIAVGFTENSIKFNRALTVARGKPVELQERFDCIVNAGVPRSDVLAMIKASPEILGMKKETIQMKIDILVNELGYTVSTLASFPSYLGHACKRVKLRCSMYNWLVGEKKVALKLSLCTIVTCTDERFMTHVNLHPDGPLVWENLKKQI